MAVRNKRLWLGLLLANVLSAQRVAGTQNIFTAIAQGDAPEVEALLKADPKLANARNDLGQTPLHLAVGGLVERPALVELLLKFGADVNAREKDGRTPLHGASAKGYKHVCSLLLASGADVNAKDTHGRSPLKYATAPDHRAVAEFLVAHGAEMDVFDAAALGKVDRIRELLAKDPSLVNAGIPGQKPLHLAARNRQNKAADLLIAHGATLDLLTAAATGRRDRVRSFLDPDPTPLTRTSRVSLNSALRWAVMGGQKQVVEFLIARGADVNAGRYTGETPLHVAARIGDVEMAKLLLKHGADRNAKPLNSILSLTPLQVAMATHHPEVVKLLSQR